MATILFVSFVSEAHSDGCRGLQFLSQQDLALLEVDLANLTPTPSFGMQRNVVNLTEIP